MYKKEAIVKCSQCQSHGFKSNVHVSRRTSYSSDKEYFHDEEGIYHEHDKNTYAFEYRCDKGHSWTKHVINSCWCGFNAEIANIIISKVA